MAVDKMKFPGTVMVHSTDLGFRWWCSCGAAGGDRDERACRDEGFAHQRRHPNPLAPASR